MQFNSTAYLVFNLEKKLNYNRETIKHFLNFFRGFGVKPGSIKFDENGNFLTLSMSLPDNDAVEYGVTINNKEEIMITLTINGIIINIFCIVYAPHLQYSMLIDGENERNSGIYYYDSKVFDDVSFGYKEQYAFYDAEVLKIIKSLGDLTNAIGTSSENINNLGFTPDLIKWEDESSGHKSDAEVISGFNEKIRAINYDSIMALVATFDETYESVNEPISIGRN